MKSADGIVQKAAAMREQGSLSEARELLADAVQKYAGNWEIHSMLGEISGLAGDYEAALNHLRIAVEMAPDQMQPRFMLGVVYENLGRRNEALDCFERLRLQNPALPLPLRWIGLLLCGLGRLNEAAASYNEALRLDPDYEEALIGLATVRVRQHRIEEAEPLLISALAASPANTAAMNELSRIYRLQGRAEQAVATLRRALQAAPDSRSLASNLLYALCDQDFLEPEEVAREHIHIAKRLYPAAVVGKTGKRSTEARLSGCKIRVGYLSGDFFTHSVAAFIEPLLAHHDQDRIMVFCYANVQIPDETTTRLQGYLVTWRNIYGLAASGVAEIIQSDEIDILVDLSGHTAGNRLDVCALRPAPVQVSWIGYPHSTGLSQIDYYLTDRLCDPPGMTEHLYREKLWRLPRIFCTYLPPLQFPAVSPLPQHRTGHITFGCFNNFSKINQKTLTRWAEILRRVPDSRLCLKSHALGGSGLQAELIARFAAAGIAEERIRLIPYTDSQYRHMELYADIDIALDTYPYHGTTTTCEALWMGVPVLTLAGRSHLARVGVSLLSAVGLQELIAEDEEQYADMAVQLAKDELRRTELRSNLRLMMAASPLLDAAGVTREVEDAYRRMLGTPVKEPCGVTPDMQQGSGCGVSRSECNALYIQGQQLYSDERFEEAANLLLKAVSLEPHAASCRMLLGASLQALGRSEEALYHYRYLFRFDSGQLAGLGKGLADVYCVAAVSAYEAAQEGYAVSLCDKALELVPNHLMAHFRRCLYTFKMCGVGECVEEQRALYAKRLFELISLDLGDAEQQQQAIAAISELTPFFLAYLGEDERALQEAYGGWVCNVMKLRYPEVISRSERYHITGRKIRLGIVSAHFYNHSVWKIITSGWLKELDRSSFEIRCYYPGSVNDQATVIARNLSDGFVQSLDIGELIQAITEDCVDLLIYPGIGMDPYVQQLAALRLAPVQCASWGHPITTGMPTIDYFISSDLMEPVGAERHYSEQLIKLPNLSVCYHEIAPVIGELPSQMNQVTTDDLLFLCCQNLFKYLPQHDDLFPAIAAQVPMARFIFVNTYPALQQRFVERMKCAFERYGLSASRHIMILPKLSGPEYAALNARIDIYLDNPGWSGGNTTLESLPFNKPIVTLPGRFMRGRHSAAFLRMMGLTELIVDCKADFVALAVKLAVDKEYYKLLSDRINNNKSAIYQDTFCIRELESFLRSCLSDKL